MIILPSRVKTEDEKKKTGLILPSRVKDTKIETTQTVTPVKTKSGVILPPKKQVSEVEKFNKEQGGFWKTIARVLLPKKLEQKYGVEKIEPVKTTLSGGWENLTPEQQDTAKEIFKKETPTALKAKVPMFFQSLKETSTKDIPYYGSGKEAVELVGVARAYNRVKDGKGTEKDNILLNDYYEEQERQTELQKNVGYRAGETIKGSVRFMGELLPVAIVEALTGTLAPAGEAYATSKLAQKGTKQVIEGMIKDKVTRDLVKDVAKKKLATLTKQFILTAPTNITGGTAERMIGVVDTETGEIYQEGQPISDAIVNATTGHAVELITELGGGVSGKVLGGLTAPLKKVATKTAIFKALQKKFIGASDAKIEALLRKTGWNGVIGEFFEERDADILNQALYSLGLGDQKFEGLTKDDIATELIAFSVMGGGTSAIKSVVRLKEGIQKRQDIKKTQEQKAKVKMPPKKVPISPETAPTSVQTQETVKDTTKPAEATKTASKIDERFASAKIQPLIQEAKKYKSAEEFVNSQIEQGKFKDFVEKNQAEPWNYEKMQAGTLKKQSKELAKLESSGAPKEINRAQANWQNYGQYGEIEAEKVYGKPDQYGDYIDKNGNRIINPQTGETVRDIKNYDTGEITKGVITNAQLKENLLETYRMEEGKKYLKEIIDILPKNPDGSITAYRIGNIGGDGPQSYTLSEGMARTFSHQGTDIPLPGQPGLPKGGYKEFGQLSSEMVKIDPKGIKAWIPYDSEILVEPKYVTTKSQLTDIWKKAQEKPIEKVEAPKKKAKPIKYESTIKKSGLAQSVRRKAIREKLIYGFDKRFRDLPEYDKRIKTEDRDKAIDFVLNDTDNAYEVAMGRQKPKGDMLPEDVYVAMVDYYTELEDVEKVLDLTMNSELVGEATLMGQRIQALSQLDPLSAGKVLNDIKKEKEKALAEDKKKRGKKSKADETKDMKDSIDKDTQKGVNQSRKKVKTWVELVESLKC